MIARKRAKEQLRPRSPDPVDGRKHIDVQTELYLEELSDRVEEADVEIQTDAFLDRPPSPLFIPAKSGVDIETQIYDGEVCVGHKLLCLLSMKLKIVFFTVGSSSKPTISQVACECSKYVYLCCTRTVKVCLQIQYPKIRG